MAFTYDSQLFDQVEFDAGVIELLVAGGAIAAGLAPVSRTTVSSSGAPAQGLAVVARASVSATGAIAGGLAPTPGQQTVLVPAGGALAQAVTPAPSCDFSRSG